MRDVIWCPVLAGAIRSQRIARERAAGLEAGRHQDAVADGGGGPQRAARAQRVLAGRSQRRSRQHAAEAAQPRDFFGQPGAAEVPPRQRAEGAIKAGRGEVVQLCGGQAGRPRQQARRAARFGRRGAVAQRFRQRRPMPAGHACRRAAAEAGCARGPCQPQPRGPPLHQCFGHLRVMPAQACAGKMVVGFMGGEGGGRRVDPAGIGSAFPIGAVAVQ
ncbi:hypothetical protein D9M68_437810 [compost metagenome]